MRRGWFKRLVIARTWVLILSKGRGVTDSLSKTRSRDGEGRASAISGCWPDHVETMLIGYARVSTVDQNLALQRDALTEAGCQKIFTEQMSGAVTDRPALHDALEFARSGDTLIVWKLDRLARSMKQLIETIENLRLRGIGFRSLTEALDTTTAQGRLVFHMFGALAEFERSLIRERTRAGLTAARRAGRTGGRPPKLTEDDLDVARALLANPDIGVTQIAHRLGASPATLYRYIPAARTANTPSE
jgi:DNA invertase Pin-like site-specific DNA recombinase